MRLLFPAVISIFCLPLLSAQKPASQSQPAQSPTAPQNPPAQSAMHFRDVSREVGITASGQQPWLEKRYIVESMSGGIALFDCDNDGRLDILVANDSTVDHFIHGGDPLVTLYHQERDGKFVDITKAAGLAHRGWGMGVAVADFDNDGWLDFYVTGYGGNALYRNLGNCKFEDVTERAGVASGGFSTGAAWADYDRDGKVDLFVSRYVHTDVNHLPPPEKMAARYKGLFVEVPWGMEGETDLLFHNRSDGTFEEVAKKAGVSDPDKHYGLGVVWGDYDNDGWPDLYVANDTGPKYLYRNKHDGTFEEVGLLSGVGLGGEGEQFGSMGVDFGDFDRDGKLDITVTNFAGQPDDLYRNQGDQGFTDLAWSSKMGQPTYPYVKWGTGFVDFDNDGLPDIFVASGHIYPQVDTVANEVRFREPILLFYNKGNRTFDEIANPSGLNDLPLQARRGAAFGDINNDGNIDVVVFNVGAPPSVFLNETRNTNHRALFQLVGTKSNKAAIGARITVHAGDSALIEEVRGGSSYLSQNDLRVHFGLGPRTTMESVDITWPNGNRETFSNLAADTIYMIVEGEGKIKNKIPLPPPAGAPAK